MSAESAGAGTPSGAGAPDPVAPAPPEVRVRDLLPLLRPHRRPLALAAGLSLAGAAAALAQPALVGQVISAVGDGRPVLPAVGVLVAVLVAGALLGAFQQ